MSDAQGPPLRRVWIEPWFFSYAFLGVAVAGLAPILLPLSVGRGGSATSIGLIVGAFNLGGLSSPVWGGLADRKGLHRVLLICGLLGTAAALAIFPFTSSLAVRIAMAFIQGTGAASAATVANLAIVEIHPRSEWDERLGWLQTFYGGGQIIGLLLAGLVSNSELKSGFLIAAGITLAACLPALSLKKSIRAVPIVRPLLAHPSRHSELSAGSPQAHYHHPDLDGIADLIRSFSSPFRLFLVAWLISFAGAASFFSLYPILMKQLYGIDPSASSAVFAVAAAAGLFLYAPAGIWSRRYGPMRILRAALIVRIIAFIALFVLGATALRTAGAVASLSFVLIVTAWSLISVTGTEIAAQFSNANEGEGLGVFNAATAIAGVAGAVIGGWSAGVWGYAIVPVLGIIGITAGILLIGFVAKTSRDAETKEER